MIVRVVWSLENGTPKPEPLPVESPIPRSRRACASSRAEALAEGRTRLRDDVPGMIPPSPLAAPLGSPPLALLGPDRARGLAASTATTCACSRSWRTSPVSRSRTRVLHRAGRPRSARARRSLDSLASSPIARRPRTIGGRSRAPTAERVPCRSAARCGSGSTGDERAVHVSGAGRRAPCAGAAHDATSLDSRAEGAVPTVELISAAADDARLPDGVEYTPADRSRPTVPVQLHGGLVGHARVLRLAGPAFRPAELALLEGMAAAGRARAHGQRIASELEAGFLATIDALVRALEARTCHLGPRALDRRARARASGAVLGLDSGRRCAMSSTPRCCTTSARSASLRAPAQAAGRSRAETRAMRAHPELGARILEPVERLRAARAARALLARALGRQRLSRRPRGRADPARRAHHRGLRRLRRDGLRPSLPRRAQQPPSGVAELRAHAGTQFDPRVVDAFVEELGTIGRAS